MTTLYLSVSGDSHPEVHRGMVRIGRPTLLKFIEQCFARVWPKRLHSFGRAEEAILGRFPFHSADSSSYATSSAFGSHATRGGGRVYLPTRGRAMKLHAVRSHMEEQWLLEQKLRDLWQRELAQLEAA